MESQVQNPEFRINPENFCSWLELLVGRGEFEGSVRMKDAI